MTATEWEPGDPLYPRRENGGQQYRSGLFNFRDDYLTDDCRCPDAASWPTTTSRPLVPGDELEDFIAHWHRWNRTQETA